MTKPTGSYTWVYSNMGYNSYDNTVGLKCHDLKCLYAFEYFLNQCQLSMHKPLNWHAHNSFCVQLRLACTIVLVYTLVNYNHERNLTFFQRHLHLTPCTTQTGAPLHPDHLDKKLYTNQHESITATNCSSRFLASSSLSLRALAWTVSPITSHTFTSITPHSCSLESARVWHADTSARDWMPNNLSIAVSSRLAMDGALAIWSAGFSRHSTIAASTSHSTTSDCGGVEGVADLAQYVRSLGIKT